MATSLAAKIKTELRVDAALVEGHDGVYDVAVDGEVIYTNQSTCSQGFPSNEELLAKIVLATGLLPNQSAAFAAGSESADSPFCSLPETPADTGSPEDFPLASQPDDRAGCC